MVALPSRPDRIRLTVPKAVLVTKDEEDLPGSKLRDEMQQKRKAVMSFFQYPFPVYLVRLENGRRVRVSTANRAVSVYTRFDFTTPVVTRAIL